MISILFIYGATLWWIKLSSHIPSYQRRPPFFVAINVCIPSTVISQRAKLRDMNEKMQANKGIFTLNFSAHNTPDTLFFCRRRRMLACELWNCFWFFLPGMIYPRATLYFPFLSNDKRISNFFFLLFNWPQLWNTNNVIILIFFIFGIGSRSRKKVKALLYLYRP